METNRCLQLQSITLPLIASLLFILSQATEFKYKIDLTRCGVDTVCFVRKSCLEAHKTDTATAPTVLVDYDSVEKDEAGVKSRDLSNLDGENCEAVIQIKPYSKYKYLVMMKLESPTAAYDKNLGFGVWHNSEKQFECSSDPGASSKPAGDNSNFDLTYTGEQPNPDIQDTMMFCSFFITHTAQSKIDHGMDGGGYKTTFPLLKYTDNGVEKTLTYTTKADKFWSTPGTKATCNGDNAKSVDHSDNFIELIQADTSKTPITCDKQKLRVKYDGKVVEADQLDCDSTDEWSWKGEDGQTVVTDSAKELEIGCIKNSHCTKCTDPLSACPLPECTPPTIETENGCKILKCPENSFVSNLDKNNMKIDNGVKCKKSAAGAPAAWFTDETNEVTKLSCRTTIPSESTTSKCPEEGCETPTTESAAKEDSPSGANVGLIAGALVGTIAVLGVIGGLVFYFKVHKKRKAGPTSKGAPASSTKASNKKSSEKSKSKSAEVRAKDKKESGSSGSSEKPSGVPTGEAPKEPAKAEETPKDKVEQPTPISEIKTEKLTSKVETPGATPAATAPATPATPATPAAAPAAAAAAAPKSNPDDQTANAPV